MTLQPHRLVLGSGSPRRRALLDQLDIGYEVRVAEVDERSVWTADVAESVRRSAQLKFEALRQTLVPGEVLLTADTLVSAGSSPLGKPASVADARAMLAASAGRTLQIVTAVVVGSTESGPRTHDVTTHVRLRLLTDDEIDAYLATGVAMDKAGALELQGAAASFIESVRGCWSNVVGLPLCVVRGVATGGEPAACSGAACGRVAEREADVEPTIGVVGSRQASAVDLDDLGDDRQPET